jgi:hypothetical protein
MPPLPVNRNGFIVQVTIGGSAKSAGVGFVVADRHVVTCAHVVNKALGRGLREQARPDPGQLVRVRFVLLGGPGLGPERSCRVEAWQPPSPADGSGGEDIAGLVLQDEDLPRRAGPARLLDPLDEAIFRDVETKLFGFPDEPFPRPEGEWATCHLRGLVSRGMLMLEGEKGRLPVRPGFSGSPVIRHDASGDVVIGMLVVAPRGAAWDAHALPISRVLSAWPQMRQRSADPVSTWTDIPGPAEVGTRNVLGRQGADALRAALASLGVDDAWSRRPWTAEALRQLEEHLASHEDPEVRAWPLRTVRDALIALETVELLKSQTRLDSIVLRRALAALRASAALHLPVLPRCDNDTEAVEAVAFSYTAEDPYDERGCLPHMARFVLLLLAPTTGQAIEAVAGADGGKAFRRWAESIGWVQVNNAERFAAPLRQGQHLRLIIGLHASLSGDWPESLEAWLRLDGELYDHASFPFPTVDRAGAEKALGAAVAWAHNLVRDGLDSLELRHVDIAAPTTLLLNWRPEETDLGNALLGVWHDVVAHWSGRLNPPERWIIDEAARRLAKIDGHLLPAPVKWLEEEQTARYDHLRSRLSVGSFQRAIGLEHRPSPEVMDLLFRYIPIVLWPSTPAGFPVPLRSRINDCWETLPAGFLDAYRSYWQEGQAADLAAVRAVWDDREWLEFCDQHSRRAYQ